MSQVDSLRTVSPFPVTQVKMWSLSIKAKMRRQPGVTQGEWRPSKWKVSKDQAQLVKPKTYQKGLEERKETHMYTHTRCFLRKKKLHLHHNYLYAILCQATK